MRYMFAIISVSVIAAVMAVLSLEEAEAQTGLLVDPEPTVVIPQPVFITVDINTSSWRINTAHIRSYRDHFTIPGAVELMTIDSQPWTIPNLTAAELDAYLNATFSQIGGPAVAN